LRGECFGTMANMGTLESCADQAETRVPVDRPPLDPDLVLPKTSIQGSFGGRVACSLETRTAHPGLFDDEGCIAGRGFLVGDSDIGDPDDPLRLFLSGVPERVAIMSPFRMDRWEVTVGRWRDAVARGFTSPDTTPVANDAPLDRNAPVNSTLLCTWSKAPIAG